MSRVAVVTDSAADLAPETARAAGIRVVPLSVTFGDASFQAGVDLSNEEFWSRMTAPGAPFPTTAAASPGAFQTAFEEAFAGGAGGVVYVGISGSLSATIQSAEMARDMLPGRPIFIVDSRSASMAVGVLALLAAEMAAAAEGDAAQIAAAVGRRVGDTSFYVALETLEYLRRGGRIGNATALIGTLISLKPILTIRDGIVEPCDRVRTRGRARERVMELLTQRPAERIAILHAGSPDVEEMRDQVVRRVPGGIDPARVTIQLIGASIGPHVGPGAYGGVILYPPG